LGIEGGIFGFLGFFGGVFGLESVEFVEGVAVSAVGGVDAALEAGVQIAVVAEGSGEVSIGGRGVDVGQAHAEAIAPKVSTLRKRRRSQSQSAYPVANPIVPDVTINASAPVGVVIAALNIPTSTAVTLYLTSENGPDSVATCGALSGSTASSTAMCTNVNFPSGVAITNITNILAVW
jgi:hypothetical protein